MALLSTVSHILSRPVARSVRELVEEMIAERRFVTKEDLEAVQADLQAPADAEKLAALETEVVALKKKLSMAMGALQAASAQLAETQRAADEALATARQANQQAVSAKAAAEAAADGAQEIEASLQAPVRAAVPSRPVIEQPVHAVTAADENCAVTGCDGKLRARGFCAKHYQQWKRNNLEGFVSGDGTVLLADGTRWRVALDLAGLPVTRQGGALIAKGSAVPAEPLPA